MAEKTVVVRLKALVDDYNKAFGSASKATDDLVNKAGNIQQLGQSTAALGSTLTRNVTLPIVALGGAAVKMAGDFDAVFSTMRSTAGVAASEVDGLKDAVLGISKDTGRGPQELAEALLLIRSSGFEGAAALDVLTASAKGAAAGMGETREIANAITNVVSGYGAANITAAEAMDVLTASVQEGKAEASEMAPQFGRLVPIAAELGVSFADVAGTLAYLTRASGDAAMSSTQLNGILSKLLKPSQAGAEALDAIGLSAAKLRPLLEDDLHGTLVMLREQLGDNGFQILFDDAEALRGALQLTGAGMKDAQQVIENVTDSAGAADQAFAIWADNMGAQNAQAWAELQAAMIEFGDQVAPVVSDVIGFIADLVSAFSDLPDWAQKAAVGFLAMLAALGPLLTVGGNVMAVIGGIRKALDTVQTSLVNASAGALNMGTNATTATSGVSRMSSAAALASKAVAALGVALVGLELFGQGRANRIADEIEGITEGLDTGKLTDVRESLSLLREELDRLDDREGKGRLFSFEPLGLDAFATSGDADRNDRIKTLRDEIAALEEQEGSLVDQEREVAEAYVGSDNALAGLNEETVNAVNALQEYADALAAQMDPLFGMVDALESNRQAQANVTAAQDQLNAAVAEHGPTSDEARAAEERLAQAHRDAAGSALDVHAATAQLQAGIESGTVSVDEATAMLNSWVSQGLITQETANNMAFAFAVARDRANELGHTDANVEVGVLGWETALARLGDVDRAARAISQARVHVGVTGYAGGRAAGGPVRAGEVYTVGERGPEFFVPDRDGRILTDAQAYMSGSMMSAANWSGGSTTVLQPTFVFNGPVASEAEAARWVAQAWNRAASGGHVNVKGRRL